MGAAIFNQVIHNEKHFQSSYMKSAVERKLIEVWGHLDFKMIYVKEYL